MPDLTHDPLTLYKGRRVCVTGVVCSGVSTSPLINPKPNGNLSKFIFKTDSVQGRAFSPSHAEESYLSVSLHTRENDSLPQYGQSLQLCGELHLPDGQRNPGGFDYRHYLHTQGISATLSVKPHDWEPYPKIAVNPFIQSSLTLRKQILSHSKAVFTPQQSAMLNGILIGERHALAGDLLSDFETTGTVHILATAGLHVGILAMLLLGLFSMLQLSRKSASLLTLLSLWLYVIMAEGRTAVLRAVILISVYLFARLVEREPDLWNALGIAALIIVFLRPLELFSMGFQLSFATVITLLLWMPLCKQWITSRLEKRTKNRILISLMDYTLVAFVAQCGVLPLIAYYAHLVSLSAVPANALVVPLVSPLLLCGFAGAFLSLIHPALAIPFDRAAQLLLDILVQQIQWWGKLGHSVLSMQEPPPLLIVSYYALLWGGGLMLKQRKSKTRK
jgi:competence protein ComEC